MPPPSAREAVGRIPAPEWKYGLEFRDGATYRFTMTVTLPDTPATLGMSEDEIRLELACSLFATGRASSRAAADIAGLGYDEFLDALRERHIPRYNSAMLREDIENLNRLFPHDPLPLPKP